MRNKLAAFMIVITASSLLFTPIDLEARGGGRGGGGGGRGGGSRGGGGRSAGASRGGGSYSGGRSMNRTPTMSRTSNRPAQGRFPETRPAASQARAQQPRPAQQVRTQQARPAQQARAQQPRQIAQQRPATANRADVRRQVDQYARTRPAQNVDRQALGQRSQNFSRNRPNQITQNRQLSDRTSQRLQQTRPNSRDWFNRDFFDRHDIDIGYRDAGANLWRPAAWATLATWGSWNWSTPYYYDNGGYAYPITLDESSYYTTPYSTTSTETQFGQDTQTNVATGGGDWLPLGVFAVASNANGAAYSNRFMQLAINRNGEISGVLYNSSTDDAQTLNGTVDSNSQKAYWALTDKPNTPVASTGIYNLTEDQTPINVHFADGSDQTWTIVRLKQQ